MEKFIIGIQPESVAEQIAILLNRHNKLKKQHTSSSILSSPTSYIISLGGNNVRHIDGEQKVIGVIGLQKTSRDVSLLHHLCVHEDFRRQGLASYLLKQGIIRCTTPLIQAHVRSDNFSSLNLCERHGFVYIQHTLAENYFILTLGRWACDNRTKH